MNLIPVLEAQTYLSVFTSGRTAPCAIECVDSQGNPREYVVKFFSSIETGVDGLLREVVASQLARFLGFIVPDPAVIRVTPEFANSIPDTEVSRRVKNSIGLNFGSSNITGGYTTWPREKSIPRELHKQALEIYVFDMLIQNPDRRRDKPNILWKGDEFILIDHEMAFSFLLDILSPVDAWKVSSLPLLTKDHIFHLELKRTSFNFDRIIGAIDSISEQMWHDIESNIPIEWKSEVFLKIRKHIELVQSNLDLFIDDIRRSLL